MNPTPNKELKLGKLNTRREVANAVALILRADVEGWESHTGRVLVGHGDLQKWCYALQLIASALPPDAPTPAPQPRRRNERKLHRVK